MASTKNNVKKDHKCACHKNGACKCKNCTCKASENDSVKYTNVFAAYRAFWRRGFTEWSGTSSRSEYWLSVVGNLLAIVGLGGITLGAVAIETEIWGRPVTFSWICLGILIVYVLAGIIPYLSLMMRRIHDIGASSWWWLICLIPRFGDFVFLVISILPTKTDGNKYHKFNK